MGGSVEGASKVHCAWRLFGGELGPPKHSGIVWCVRAWSVTSDVCRLASSIEACQEEICRSQFFSSIQVQTKLVAVMPRIFFWHIAYTIFDQKLGSHHASLIFDQISVLILDQVWPKIKNISHENVSSASFL